MVAIEGRRAQTTAAKRQAKLKSTMVIKRRKTLIGKADKFHKDCGFEVLLLLQNGAGRSYVYTSAGMPSCHPVVKDLVSLFAQSTGSKLI
jgi:hypothetical protein